jgi:hypothetical protein
MKLRYRAKTQVGAVIASLVIIGLWLGLIAGWVMNIITIANSSFTPLEGFLVLRVVGIFVAPLGAVLGWI